jgi:hypothetical protein
MRETPWQKLLWCIPQGPGDIPASSWTPEESLLSLPTPLVSLDRGKTSSQCTDIK